MGYATVAPRRVRASRRTRTPERFLTRLSSSLNPKHNSKPCHPEKHRVQAHRQHDERRPDSWTALAQK